MTQSKLLKVNVVFAHRFAADVQYWGWENENYSVLILTNYCGLQVNFHRKK